MSLIFLPIQLKSHTQCLMITSFVDEKDVGPIGGQTGIHDDASMSSWNVSECETILILIINCNRQ